MELRFEMTLIFTYSAGGAVLLDPSFYFHGRNREETYQKTGHQLKAAHCSFPKSKWQMQAYIHVLAAQ
jgi:hypothetical protein